MEPWATEDGTGCACSTSDSAAESDCAWAARTSASTGTFVLVTAPSAVCSHGGGDGITGKRVGEGRMRHLHIRIPQAATDHRIHLTGGGTTAMDAGPCRAAGGAGAGGATVAGHSAGGATCDPRAGRCDDAALPDVCWRGVGHIDRDGIDGHVTGGVSAERTSTHTGCVPIAIAVAVAVVCRRHHRG